MPELVKREIYERESVWARYETPSPDERRRVRRVVNLVPAGTEAVLEVGCGVGSIINEINAPRVVGVDFSRIALQRVIGEKVIADAGFLPVREGAFDTIICSEILEHLEDNSLFRCIDEIIRIRPSTIVLSAPHKENLNESCCYCAKCRSHFHVHNHVQSFSVKDIDTFFRGYSRSAVEFTTVRSPTPQFLLALRRRFRYYAYVDGARCTHCGEPASPPATILRYLFGSLQTFSTAVAKVLGRTEYYHMVLKYTLNR